MQACANGNLSLDAAAANESQEFLGKQQDILQRFLDIYQILSWILMGLGLVGHTLSFVTLKRAASMQTPHFVFYKFMTLAELFYCLNFFVSQLVESVFLVSERGKSYFRNPSSAYFFCAIARFVYSSTGYLVLYMAVIISIDRFAALWCTKLYRRFPTRRKQKLAFYFCWTALFFSTVAHSWTGLFRDINTVPVQNETRYECVSRNEPEIYIQMKYINIFFNMAIRVSYPPILLILTAGVIWGFTRYQAHRASVTGQTYDLRRQHERRRERNLFYLMAVVVMLAFVQVVPTEAKRYLQWTYRETDVDHCILLIARKRPIDRLTARQAVILWALFVWLRIFANLATQMDRSLKFYLYVMFNNQFREEALRILCDGRFDRVTGEMNVIPRTRNNFSEPSRVLSGLFQNHRTRTDRTAVIEEAC